jgi:Tol biopolymer transport system component
MAAALAAALTAAAAPLAAQHESAGASGPASRTGHGSIAVPPEPGESRLRNIRQLTFDGNNAEAYWARSGRELIFQRQVDVEHGCDQQYIMDADGRNLRRVSNGLGRTTCGYFYQDDRRILYSSSFEHSPDCPAPPDRSQGYVWPLGHLEIYTALPDGSDLRKLTENGAYNAEATLSPDGSRIIFTSTMDGDIELYSMNTDGTGLRRVTNRVGYDGGAFFSPDGTRIVWRAMYPETAADSADYARLLGQRLVRPSRMELWVADADGSNPRRVTHLGGANFAPFFTPDGEGIIFASNHPNPRGRNFDLYLIRQDGTGLEQVTTHGDFDGFPMFSPDGTKLVWASNRNASTPGDTNLFVADWGR